MNNCKLFDRMSAMRSNKIKFSFVVVFILNVLLSLAASDAAFAQEKRPYVLKKRYMPEGGISTVYDVTFCYNSYYDQYDSKTVFFIETDDESQWLWRDWVDPQKTQSEVGQLVNVRIQTDFSEYKPKTCRKWFHKAQNVEWLENLNTSEVTDMSAMFQGCSFKTLEIPKTFNTAKVEDMRFMFDMCQYLESLDLSMFNTELVADMSMMFAGCADLKTLDIENFSLKSVTNAANMFNGCRHLTSLKVHIQNEVSNLTNISGMFAKCGLVSSSGFSNLLYKLLRFAPNVEDASGLFSGNAYVKNIDITYDIDLGNAKNIAGMFSNCEQLESISGLNTLNTSNVVNMGGMFYGCKNLQNVDLSSFDAKNVASVSSTSSYTQLKEMFSGCESLTSVVFGPQFTPSKCTDFQSMFYGCKSLKSLNLVPFALPATGDVNVSNMFYGCESLKMIFATDGAWHNMTQSTGMFTGCTQLAGEKGTVYDNNHTDSEYAHTDGGNSNPGYFSSPREAYAALDGDKLVFYYDGGRFNHSTTFNMREYPQTYAIITNSSTRETITTVEFDQSFQYYYPTTCYMWFYGFKSLTAINGSEYLHTEYVKSMNDMFFQCVKLTKLDLSGFDTRLVQDMEWMFKECSELETIKFGENFVTSSVANFNGMFMQCAKLKELDLSTFSTAGIDNTNTTLPPLKAMFSMCFELKYVKFGKDFKPATDMSSFFAHCYQLETVVVDNDDWNTSEITRADAIFAYCRTEDLTHKLTGGNGTVWDAVNADNAAYFRIDTVEHPGYLTKLPYTITYYDSIPNEMLTKGEYTDLPQSYYPYDTNVSFEEYNLSDDKITIPIPKKEGYRFIGWTNKKNTSLSDDTPVKEELTIDPATTRYNQAFVANWEPLIPIEVNISDNATFPVNAEAYCNGKENSVSLPFEIVKGEPTDYVVTFKNDAIPRYEAKLNGATSVVIPIPESLLSGVYEGTITFNGDPEYYKPGSYAITITADITPDVAVQLYTDMLIADNHDGRFTAYQWFKDGSPIADATHGYYYDEKLGGKYTVELTTTDGGKFMSCPVKLVSTKALAQSVKAYPNPARRGETFAVEIADYDPAQEYSIMIFSANGLLVKKLTNVEQTTEMSLPTGVYSGSLISGGSKYGFKLIVE